MSDHPAMYQGAKRRQMAYLLVLTIGLCLAGCDLFYPDDPVEYPQEQDTSDPFNFSGILNPTQARFAKTNYEDLFHENFAYHANDNQLFNRRQVSDHLYQSVRNYEKVQVAWDTTAASSGEKTVFNDKSETYTVYREYALTTMQFVPDSMAPLDTSRHVLQEKKYYGRSRFDVVFHSLKNTWCILAWYDELDGPGLTFFHPDFRAQ
jgi:hypothetical protein